MSIGYDAHIPPYIFYIPREGSGSVGKKFAISTDHAIRGRFRVSKLSVVVYHCGQNEVIFNIRY